MPGGSWAKKNKGNLRHLRSRLEVLRSTVRRKKVLPCCKRQATATDRSMARCVAWHTCVDSVLSKRFFPIEMVVQGNLTSTAAVGNG